ncbi:hypothetical protein KKA27_02035 [Patescibacteria group bacterium]|nr:hypothetical protein [Patescibacteria group bacterium]
MQITLPNIKEIIPKLLKKKSVFNKREQTIKDWLNEQQERIRRNNFLLKNKSEENNIKILNLLFGGLLMRRVRDEIGEKIAEKLKDNFQNDELLTIKYIGFKTRDLALSEFNNNYVANDLHVSRIMTRIGLLNYGFDLVKDNDLEMGNNPGDNKNYLFLHKLVLRLSDLLDRKYSPTDLDRIFWHFGRSICKNKPQCNENKCPILF